MFRFGIFSALLVSVAADIPANSVLGKNLLSKARNVQNGNYYEPNDSWMVNYSIKFNKCHTVHSVQEVAGGGGEGEGGGEQGNSNLGYGTSKVVNFQLCPSSSCSSCSGGAEYVVDMRDFVETYTGAVEEMQQSECQAVEQNCDCQYYEGDDQACLTKCYKSAGLSYCGDNQEDGNAFNVAEYMECKEAAFAGNANAYGYAQQYFIGPVCANSGKAINLAVFTDNQCTTKAPSGTYEKYNYGYTLPYSSESVVKRSCISCMKQAENQNAEDNGGNYYQQPEVSESCTQLYEGAAKCEKNLKAKSSTYRDTGSCTYINQILPALERVYYAKGGGGGKAATAFAWIFALTTIAASGVAYTFYKKVQRTTVDRKSVV